MSGNRIGENNKNEGLQVFLILIFIIWFGIKDSNYQKNIRNKLKNNIGKTVVMYKDTFQIIDCDQYETTLSNGTKIKTDIAIKYIK